MPLLRRTVKVSSRGQLTLPKDIRRDLQIRKGDFLNIYKLDENVYVLEKKTPLKELSEVIVAEAAAEGYTEEELRATVDKVKEELWREVYETYRTTVTR